MDKKILYIVNNSNYFLSHRLSVALSAKRNGYEVHLVSPEDKAVKEIKSKGIIHHNIQLTRSGVGVLSEIRVIFSIYKKVKEIEPDLVHLVTIKPVIYGGIVSTILGVKGVIAAIPGLGYSYISKGFKYSIFRFFLSFLYRLAFLKRSLRVIFQNEEDRKKISKSTGLTKDKIVLIKGSGVDLKKFSFSIIPKGIPVVSMASRLQRDKGVIEFFEAAKIIKDKKIPVEFRFIGNLDLDYAFPVPTEILNAWKKRNIIKFLGFREDINNLFKESSIIVLPSYREGFPKVLQEAAACGRPVITSNVAGCRDAIEDNVTGLLVKPRDSTDLAKKIEHLLSDKDLLEKMSWESRKLAEKEFSLDGVVEKHLKIYKELFES